MPSKATQDFQIFTGGLKGTYVEGETYPHDRLAEKYPHAFELVGGAIRDTNVGGDSPQGGDD